MALPFILAGAAVLFTGIGINDLHEGSKAKNKANEILEDAEKEYNIAKYNLEKIERNSERKLKKLGNLQLEIGQKFGEFQLLVSKLQEQLDESEYDEIEFKLPKHQLEKIKMISVSSIKFISDIMGGVILGSASSFAVYSGVAMFATASTGAAISGLSGAAASNAIMAYLGGGALSAGGLGIAGGTALLGGIALAPFITVVGWNYRDKAEENLEKALEYSNEVNEALDKFDMGKFHLMQIDLIVDLIFKNLKSIYIKFLGYFDTLKEIDEYISNTPAGERVIPNELAPVMSNGYQLAAILADIITTPLFELKKDRYDNVILNGDGLPTVLNDENGMKAINSEEIYDIIDEAIERSDAL